MNQLEVFLWAIFGGLFVVLLTAGTTFYKNGTQSTKQLSRDFILGALVTGILYPMLPESFNGVKDILTAEGIQGSIGSATITHSGSLDPGVQIGPANF